MTSGFHQHFTAPGLVPTSGPVNSALFVESRCGGRFRNKEPYQLALLFGKALLTLTQTIEESSQVIEVELVRTWKDPEISIDLLPL